MNKKIIIYGKYGQLASALSEQLQGRAVVFASSEYDFSDMDNIRSALGDIPAKAIINATAYTDVNKAETEEDAAYKANATIPAALAAYARERNLPFIHYSTDYVFPGLEDKPQTESTQPAPLSAYGRTKLAGEKKILEVGGKYLIFRTSWIYSHTGKNFLLTMLKLGAEREVLNVVSDQFGAPTYAGHLAMATIEILDKIPEDKPFPSGIYHLCNSGFTSWHGFAVAIFAQAKAKGMPLKIAQVNPITSDQFPTPARRPHNSRLDCSLAEKIFGVKMAGWKEGLRECMGG